MKGIGILLLTVSVCLFAAPAFGQIVYYETFSPVVVGPPVVFDDPLFTAPVVVASPVIVNFPAAPSPIVTTWRVDPAPTVACYGADPVMVTTPVVTSRVTYYRPVQIVQPFTQPPTPHTALLPPASNAATVPALRAGPSQSPGVGRRPRTVLQR